MRNGHGRQYEPGSYNERASRRTLDMVIIASTHSFITVTLISIHAFKSQKLCHVTDLGNSRVPSEVAHAFSKV